MSTVGSSSDVVYILLELFQHKAYKETYMIPEHLKGMSAVQICMKMEERYFTHPDVTDGDYLKYLGGLFVIAVKDALCACDSDVENFAQGRAIAFLNMVLPHDPTTPEN